MVCIDVQHGFAGWEVLCSAMQATALHVGCLLQMSWVFHHDVHTTIRHYLCAHLAGHCDLLACDNGAGFTASNAAK
jgi:hypothetical protein